MVDLRVYERHRESTPYVKRGNTLNVGVLRSKKGTLEETLEAIEKAKSKRLDVFVGPEWSLIRRVRRDYTKPYNSKEARELLRTLIELSEGSSMLIFPGTMVVYTPSGRLYNVMPVLSNGKIIYSYQKHYDGGTTDLFGVAGKHLTFYSGNKSGVFEYGGLKFGIEICADRGELSKRGVRDLDVQVYVAAGFAQTQPVIKRDGVILCSDFDMNRPDFKVASYETGRVRTGYLYFVDKQSERIKSSLKSSFLNLFRRRQ